MARIFHDGFEMGVPAGSGTLIVDDYRDSLWQCNQTNVSSGLRVIETVTNVKRSGDYSLRIRDSATSSYLMRLHRDLEIDLTEHYGSIQFRVDNVRSGYTETVVHFRDNTFAEKASIRIDSDYNLKMYIGSSLIDSAPDNLLGNLFYRIEWHLKIDATVGVFEIKVNGTTVMEEIGDTSSIGHVRYLCLGKIVSAVTTIDFYYDDIAINDTTGTVNNSWVGPEQILLLKPKADGFHTDFSPNSGSINYDKVNEVPHDSDSTFVESNTSNNIDTYDIEELIADLGVDSDATVRAVQICYTSKWVDDKGDIAPVLRLSGNDEIGDTVEIMGDYFRLFNQIYNVNPNTATTWNINDIDSMEIGVKHIEHVV